MLNHKAQGISVRRWDRLGCKRDLEQRQNGDVGPKGKAGNHEHGILVKEHQNVN